MSGSDTNYFFWSCLQTWGELLTLRWDHGPQDRRAADQQTVIPGTGEANGAPTQDRRRHPHHRHVSHFGKAAGGAESVDFRWVFPPPKKENFPPGLATNLKVPEPDSEAGQVSQSPLPRSQT